MDGWIRGWALRGIWWGFFLPSWRELTPRMRVGRFQAQEGRVPLGNSLATRTQKKESELCSPIENHNAQARRRTA